MEYELGKALESINDKLDALLRKAYPEEFKDKGGDADAKSKS